MTSGIACLQSWYDSSIWWLGLICDAGSQTRGGGVLCPSRLFRQENAPFWPFDAGGFDEESNITFYTLF